MENVLSEDSGAKVVEMYTAGHNTKSIHMVGPSPHVNLYYNSSPYDFFNLVMSELFRSGFLQECTNMRESM